MIRIAALVLSALSASTFLLAFLFGAMHHFQGPGLDQAYFFAALSASSALASLAASHLKVPE